MITIRTIRTPDWPAIMAIQHECYHQFQPEPLEVMQNKTELAPASCWVAERQGKVLGYLLCHPWRAHQPPPLSVPMKALAGHDEGGQPVGSGQLNPGVLALVIGLALVGAGALVSAGRLLGRR